MVMFKRSKRKTNYFKVNIYPTLIGEYLIQKEYGLLYRKKPTNIIQEYAANYREALMLTMQSVLESTDKGYCRTI